VPGRFSKAPAFLFFTVNSHLSTFDFRLLPFDFYLLTFTFQAGLSHKQCAQFSEQAIRLECAAQFRIGTTARFAVCAAHSIDVLAQSCEKPLK
jgi:hypothetical protein